MKKLILSMVMILGCAVLSVGAYGATQTATLDVSVNMVPACTVSVTGITFPNYIGLQVTANGDVTVTCAQSIPYTIALDAGLTYGGGGGYRAVTNISFDYIPYALFKDGGFTERWGDADFSNTYPNGTSLADTGSGIAQPHTVYGGLFGGYGGAPGLYTDTVTVSVDY